MDKKDYKILQCLSINARQGINQIAKTVGLSKNSVNERIKKLEKKKIITGYTLIINHNVFNLNFYEILIKVKTISDEFTDFLDKHDNTVVIDKLLGEWNYVLEFGCKDIETLFMFISDLQGFDLLQYEVHPILKSLKVEQFAHDLADNPLPFEKIDVPYDDIDINILYQISNNFSEPLYQIASKLNLTVETITRRIKRMQKDRIILKFSAIIDMKKLGYSMYLIKINTQTNQSALKNHLISDKRIRFSFVSASNPCIFIYLSVKDNTDLENFLLELNNYDIINYEYSLIQEQYKYQMFPKGFLKD